MRNLFIIMCLLASVGLQAQTIKGRVMEETEDGEVALPGANVYWVGTSKGSVSDANGEFKITECRRSWVISLTTEGEEKADKVIELFRMADEIFSEGMTDEDIKRLYDVLDVIERNIEKHSGKR